jgi:hypothetical protein
MRCPAVEYSTGVLSRYNWRFSIRPGRLPRVGSFSIELAVISEDGCLRWAWRCAWHPHLSPTEGLRRGIEDKTKLGRHRWVVERTLSWLLRFKRLGLRYDRTEATGIVTLTR